MSSRAAIIGSGSAHAFDALDLARRSAEDPSVEVMVFDRMGEGSPARATVERQSDPDGGYDRELPTVIREFASFLERGGKMVGNFGLVNLDRATEVAVETLKDLGLADVKIGVVRGDDVLAHAVEDNIDLPELGCKIGALEDRLICANVYLGADGVRDALDDGAQIVLGGRIADASLTTGALAHQLDWSDDDWDSLALGALAGQLLGGGCGSTGGGYADPPFRVVPDMHKIGYPILRVEDDTITVTKPAGTGGLIAAGQVKARLFHEIFDPTNYLTPDVTLDMSSLYVNQVDSETVSITGARGGPRPETLRVLVGYDIGWRLEADAALGGARCVERARLAEEILRKRLALREDAIEEFQTSLFGVNAFFGNGFPLTGSPVEVALRLALRTRDREVAEWASAQVGWLYWTVAGLVKRVSTITRALAVTYGTMPRDRVQMSTVQI